MVHGMQWKAQTTIRANEGTYGNAQTVKEYVPKCSARSGSYECFHRVTVYRGRVNPPPGSIKVPMEMHKRLKDTFTSVLQAIRQHEVTVGEGGEVSRPL